MYALRAWRPWDWIDSYVLVGSVPTRADLRNLHRLGVRAIVNMCEEFDGYHPIMAELGIEQFRLPTLDFCCPSEEDLVRGVAFIQQQVRMGRKVYIHCKAGRGRAPSLATCYLMASRRISAEEAYGIVRLVRPHVAGSLYHHPEIRAVEGRISRLTMESRKASAVAPAHHQPQR
jgi:atypical dual specificity phosphatase